MAIRLYGRMISLFWFLILIRQYRYVHAMKEDLVFHDNFFVKNPVIRVWNLLSYEEKNCFGDRWFYR